MSVGSEQDWQQAKAAVLAEYPSAQAIYVPQGEPDLQIVATVFLGEARTSEGYEKAWLSAARKLHIAQPCERELMEKMAGAIKDAKDHVEELAEGWRAGGIRDLEGKVGTRSNRNMDVLSVLSRVLSEYESRTRG